VGGSELVDQAMLVGQDERFLGAIVVVSPTGLAAAGLLPAAEGRRIAKLLGPTPLTTGPQGGVQEVADAQVLLSSPGIKVGTSTSDELLQV
jgi:long-subunit acyl-CoA synthetase (AMP-forming)